MPESFPNPLQSVCLTCESVHSHCTRSHRFLSEPHDDEGKNTTVVVQAVVRAVAQVAGEVAQLLRPLAHMLVPQLVDS